jgi:hypothetical protein
MRFQRVFLAFAFLTSVACIQGQRVVKVNLDGSGTVVDTVTLGEQARGMISAMDGMDKSTPAEKKTKKTEKLKAAAATMGEGVTFVSFEPAKDGSEKITYSFKDITKLKIDWKPSGSDTDAKPAEDPATFRLARQGANSVLTVVQAPKVVKKEATDKAKAKPKPEEMAQQMAMMKGMMAGLKMTGTLEVNGRIVKTNSPYAVGPAVTMLEVDFDQIAADPVAFQKLTEIDDPTKADPKAVAAIKGVKINTLPELTIEFAPK